MDKRTGQVLWTDNSPGANVLHGQFASPLVAEIAGRAQVIVPQGDGWVRSYDALTGESEDEEFAHLTAADRQAIREIIVETKKDLPDYWR